MKKLALHWKILIGMIVGILFGLGMTRIDGGASFVSNWINPFGSKIGRASCRERV